MVSQRQKMMISIMSGLLFFIVANPETFKLVRRILGGWVSSPTGCPTVSGLVVHAIVYFLLTWALMNMKQNRESATGDSNKTQSSDSDNSASGSSDSDNSASGSSDSNNSASGSSDSNNSASGSNGKANTSDNGDPTPYNADDDDDELSGVDTTFKLDMGQPYNQLNQYNKCACADGTEVLVLK